MKVLGVDDNLDILNLMEMVSESLGHEFEQATGGRMGLECMRNNKYDLVFLDLSMPDMTGLEVIDHLVDENIIAKQPVVLFTASYLNKEESIEDELKSKGVYAILRKPADLDKIMSVFSSLEEDKNQ